MGSGAPVGREQAHVVDPSRLCAWIPSDVAAGQVLYKTPHYYAPEHERTLAWNDPELKVDWKAFGDPIVSPNDQRGVCLRDAESFE
jgi:hypothetical protein